MLGLDELSFGGAGDIRFEDVVWIEEVGDDDVEGFEVYGPFGIEFGLAGEEAGERTGFDGTESVNDAGGASQFRDTRVTEEFEMCVWKGGAQGADGGKGEDEVTDGAAADDEDLAALFGHGVSV